MLIVLINYCSFVLADCRPFPPEFSFKYYGNSKISGGISSFDDRVLSDGYGFIEKSFVVTGKAKITDIVVPCDSAIYSVDGMVAKYSINYKAGDEIYTGGHWVWDYITESHTEWIDEWQGNLPITPNPILFAYYRNEGEHNYVLYGFPVDTTYKAYTPKGAMMYSFEFRAEEGYEDSVFDVASPPSYKFTDHAPPYEGDIITHFEMIPEKTGLVISDEDTDKEKYSINEPVEISCTVLDEHGNKIPYVDVIADIVEPDGTTNQITLSPYRDPFQFGWETPSTYTGRFIDDTPSSGIHTVTIHADKSGYTGDTATLNFEVKSSPVAKISYRIENGIIYLDGSQSYDPDGGAIQHYSWQLKDNTQEGQHIGVFITKSEMFYAKLTVTDDEGDTDSAEINLPILKYQGNVNELKYDNAKELADRTWRAGLLAEGFAMIWFDFSGVISNTRLIASISRGILLNDYSQLNPEQITRDMLLEAIPEAFFDMDHDARLQLLRSFKDLADDPPDSNYTNVVPIGEFAYVEPSGNTSFEIDLINLTNHMSEHQAVLKALITSIERFQGAVNATANNYAALQAKAIQNYSNMLSYNSYYTNEIIFRILSTITLIESNQTVMNDLEEMQQRLITDGFTDDESEYFEGLGMNESEISLLKDVFISFDINEYEDGLWEFYDMTSEWTDDYDDLYISALEVIPYDISLKPGWNLVSTPLNLTNNSITRLSSLLTGRVVAYYYNTTDNADHWKGYDSTTPSFTWDLKTIDPNKAYWIKVSSSQTLSLIGRALENNEAHLYPGWNMVGFQLYSDNIQNTMNKLTGHRVTYYYDATDAADHWKGYDSTTPSFTWDLKEINAGKGYWVKIDSNQNWVE